MQGKSFVDTNILIYQLLEPTKLTDRPKQLTAIDVMQSIESVCISTQVLSEMSNVLLKKYALHREIVIDFLQEIVSDTEVVIVEPVQIFNAIEISTKYKFSFYDSLTKRAEFPTLCRVGMDSATGFVEHSELGQVGVG